MTAAPRAAAARRGDGLPLAVYHGNWALFTHHSAGCAIPHSDTLPYSLSGYHYTHMRDLFVGGLPEAADRYWTGIAISDAVR